MTETISTPSRLPSRNESVGRSIPALYTLLVLCAGLALTGPANADDDRVSPAERARILKVLEEAGCTSPTEIERDDGGYEVDNARCQDGVFDIKLDQQFKIVSREREG